MVEKMCFFFLFGGWEEEWKKKWKLFFQVSISLLLLLFLPSPLRVGYDSWSAVVSSSPPHCKNFLSQHFFPFFFLQMTPTIILLSGWGGEEGEGGKEIPKTN